MKNDSFTPTEAPNSPNPPRSSHLTRRSTDSMLLPSGWMLWYIPRFCLKGSQSPRQVTKQYRAIVLDLVLDVSLRPLRDLQESTADLWQIEVSFGHYLAANLPVQSGLIHQTVLLTS